MLPWLGPQVAAASFEWRVLAYTSIWVLHSFAVQAAVVGMLTWYKHMGWAKKNTRNPSLPRWKMLLGDVEGYYSWMIGAGIVHAW